MTERPILFSAEMVRAILAGRKTMTRRVMRPQPEHWFPPYWGEVPGRPGTWVPWTAPEGTLPRAARGECATRCPYGTAGDRLWVKETCRIWWDGASVGGACVEYRADGAKVGIPGYGRIIPGVGAVDGGALSEFMQTDTRWRPSIYVPRAVARLTLEIVAVRVERVQEITEADARAEGVLSEDEYDDIVERGSASGVSFGPGFLYRQAFERLWNGINAERGYPWASNPWVWVVSFRRVEAP